jgi:hypothetical protein
MLVAHVEHGERLINTDDPATREPLGHRPSHSSGPRCHVEDPFVSLQIEHFSKFFGEISADSRDSAVKLRRVLWIMKVSFLPVAMPMFATVSMLVIVSVLMRVFVFMTMVMSMVMFVGVIALMSVIIFLAVTVIMFVFMFLTHGFFIPSSRLSRPVYTSAVGVRFSKPISNRLPGQSIL